MSIASSRYLPLLTTMVTVAFGSPSVHAQEKSPQDQSVTYGVKDGNINIIDHHFVTWAGAPFGIPMPDQDKYQKAKDLKETKSNMFEAIEQGYPTRFETDSKLVSEAAEACNRGDLVEALKNITAVYTPNAFNGLANVKKEIVLDIVDYLKKLAYGEIPATYSGYYRTVVVSTTKDPKTGIIIDYVNEQQSIPSSDSLIESLRNAARQDPVVNEMLKETYNGLVGSPTKEDSKFMAFLRTALAGFGANSNFSDSIGGDVGRPSTGGSEMSSRNLVVVGSPGSSVAVGSYPKPTPPPAPMKNKPAGAQTAPANK